MTALIPLPSTVASLISFLILMPVIAVLHLICIYWAGKWALIMWDIYCGILRTWWFEQSESMSGLFIWPYRIMTFPFFIIFGFGMSVYIGLGPLVAVLISLFASAYYVGRFYWRILNDAR
jgi:hypothetical protein